MVTHLSCRLAWHDRGWDAHICDAPHLNSSCIVHEHIRDSRNDEKELDSAGKKFEELDGWFPPCSRDPCTYSGEGYTVTHKDPLEFRKLPSVKEELPPFSSLPSPYRWMREEEFREVCEAENLKIRGPEKDKEIGWVFEPDRQKELLKHFWKKIEPKKSLIFYYCNHGNPLSENIARVIIGVGRISEIGPQLYFGTKPGYEDRYPVWSRRITQDYPNQGVRIPYQEYINSGQSTDQILCNLPQNAFLSFSYVGEHVSDDIGVAVLERIIQSIEQVKLDGVVPGDWEFRLEWLNDVLAEVWSDRGAYPGIGSVLKYLGFNNGMYYQRSILNPMAKKGEDPLKFILRILEEEIPISDDSYKNGLIQARNKWRKIKSKQELLKKLTLFELSPDQIERIANLDLRKKSGILATEAEIIDNPYILVEYDLGTRNSERITLETIDHGMRPEGDALLFNDSDAIPQDDPRRVRAVAFTALKEASENGDTVLTFDELFERIIKRFPERRICQPDREIFLADRDFHEEILRIDYNEDIYIVSLKQIQSLEHTIASLVEFRAPRTNQPSTSSIDWKISLMQLFGEPNNEKEDLALDEKEKALETLFQRRISVLTGGAGTGKTSLLKVFLDELEQAEGKNHFLLLAPTGKARVRLSTKTKRNTMTIHQFLLKQDWYDPETYNLKLKSNRDTYKATTVVIDECSMIPVVLLGILFRSLDMGPLTRLILVGDPNQLPPIGPGRPFVDIIEWLKENQPECIASLKICMRTTEENNSSEEGSFALNFANGYQADVLNPSDDEILADISKGISKGDLEISYWNTYEELLNELKNKMEKLLGIKEEDFESFNKSLGINIDWSQSEAWQILSPTRTQYFGTDDLNRILQLEYKLDLIHKSQDYRSRIPRPFGDQEIVSTDKVIQIWNQKMDGWPREKALNYVANGEIGIVSRAKKGNYGDFLDVIFSTQPEVSYRYSRNKVNDYLELAYALTVHKAQGSDFDIVFLIIPQSASTLSRELIYTGLTRFRKKLVLLIEKDIQPLLKLRSPDCSDTILRNTQMFRLSLRPADVIRPHLEALIHRTKKGVAVRSKSEVIVADVLESLGISYEYEKTLYSKTDPKDFRLPDFTVSFQGDIYYWEHLGMLTIPSYKEAWERKKKWYEGNGYLNRLITSEDGPDGSIEADKIEQIAKNRILVN